MARGLQAKRPAQYTGEHEVIRCGSNAAGGAGEHLRPARALASRGNRAAPLGPALRSRVHGPETVGECVAQQPRADVRSAFKRFVGDMVRAITNQ